MARQSRDGDAAVSRPDRSQISMSFAGRKMVAALKSRRSSVTDFEMQVGGRTLRSGRHAQNKKPARVSGRVR